MRRLVGLAVFVLLTACGGPEGPTHGPFATSLSDLDDVSLYLNLGDSVGAGVAAGAGLGYAHLLYDNVDQYPLYDKHDMATEYPAAVFAPKAVPGDDTNDMMKQVTNSPKSGGGDVVITIYIGGNDITANPYNLFTDSGMQTVIDGWVGNMDAAVAALQDKYQDLSTGSDVVMAIATVHDPSDGVGQIPDEFSLGFCSLLQQIPPELGPTAVASLTRLNDEIRAFAAARNIIVMDSQVFVKGHGMNAPTEAERWLSNDCIHFTNEGHHQLRREFWRVLTGEAY